MTKANVDTLATSAVTNKSLANSKVAHRLWACYFSITIAVASLGVAAVGKHIAGVNLAFEIRGLDLANSTFLSYFDLF